MANIRRSLIIGATIGLVILVALMSWIYHAAQDDRSTAAVATTSRLPSPASRAPAPVAPDVPGKVVVRGLDSDCASTATASPDLITTTTHLGVAGYAGTAVRVTWRYTGELPVSGTVLFAFTAASQDGRVVKQLGYKTLDGNPIGYFVFDMATGQQNNIGGAPDVSTAGQVVAVMPSNAIAALGSNWHWSSTLNVDGEDLDVCPS